MPPASVRRPVVSAGSARSLLLTVLGELVLPVGEPVWTSSLLHVLTGVGVEEQTARQAIARGAAAGWIVGERHGREVRWEITPAGRQLIEEGAQRVYSLSADAPAWDGNWLILLITVPQSLRTVRKKLYGALSWAGFGNPTPSVWLTPHPERAAEARRVVTDLGLRESTLSFTGSSTDVGLSDTEIVQRAWDLDGLVAMYDELLRTYDGVQPEPGDPVLLTHVELVSQWQRFPFVDPQLPEALLPDWIGRRAAAMFQELRTEWYDDAHARWNEVVAETSPG
ncbi:PaaX family transcriptional regulator C-terminal domain-containing protein [Pseudonocardia sp.]|uniref:PaaX family transcriptional regulator n=1 Tax=Pseudonocardia sp. TaxID=60912 RepID=UPI0026055486|nr:PaaX family transcriptional regulator C-terminal domain-containing protein [Pseudonocardia sp.]